MGFSKRSKFLLRVVLSAFVGLSGCDELNQTPNKPVKAVAAKKDNRVPVHRFVLTRNDFDVAFDTQTGQLCRTWDWSPLGKPSKPDPDTGGSPQRKFGEFAPTCLATYVQYPSGTDPQSESMLDNEPIN
jgi:hypothetical protein